MWASRPYAIRCRPEAEAKRPVFRVLVVLERKQDIDYLKNYVFDKKYLSKVVRSISCYYCNIFRQLYSKKQASVIFFRVL